MIAGTRKSSAQIVIFFKNNGSVDTPSFSLDNSTYTVLPTNRSSAMSSAVVPQFVAASDIDLDADKDIDLLTADNHGGSVDLDKFIDSGVGNFLSSAGSSISISISPTKGAVALTDLDGDDYPDLVIGYNMFESSASSSYFPISIKYFSNNKSGDFTTGENIIQPFEPDNDIRKRFPIPSFADLDNDGDQDMFIVMLDDGGITYYKKTGSASLPAFTSRTDNFNLSPTGGVKWFPAFGDMDGDGDLYAMIGISDGKILYAENIDID